jgi:hypothetical protein
MVCKRKLIHYLLILSIGLMPAFVLASNEMHHMDSMSTSPFDCDSMIKAPDLSCENQSCLSTTHACGANSGIGFIPINISGEFNLLPRSIKNPPDKVSYRSRLAHSIYRPPIA